MFISKAKISYPITLSSDELFIKRILGVHLSETDDDSVINTLLESATEQTEGRINQDIAYTNNSIILEDFVGSKLVVPQGNLNSITSIVNNDASTLITYFESKKSYAEFIVSFDFNLSLGSMTLNFSTGWENASDVPRGLKQAIICKASDLYNMNDLYNSTWEILCQQYKLL